MMWASFARMCCRSGVEDKLEMVGAVQEFLSRWLRAFPFLFLAVSELVSGKKDGNVY